MEYAAYMFRLEVSGVWHVCHWDTVVVVLKMEAVYRSNFSYLQTSLHVRLTKSENYEQSLLWNYQYINSSCFRETKIYTISEPLQGATNMQSQFIRVRQIMECPVCMECMRSPITLCANGHNICNICWPKVWHSPTCRHQFWDTRNVVWIRKTN